MGIDTTLGKFVDNALVTATGFGVNTWKNVILDGAAMAAKLLFTLIKWSFIAWLFLCSAAFVYAAIYWILMPVKLHSLPIYFDYGPHSEVRDDYTFAPRALPTATIDFLSPALQWEPTELAGLEPYASRYFAPSQRYTFVLELVLPETEVNRRIGMFMLNFELRTSEGEKLGRCARAASVRDAGPIVRLGRTFVWWFALSLGLVEEEQTISVLCFDGFMDPPEHPLRTTSITISHPRLQVSSAQMYITAQLTGVRYFMYHWFLSASVLAVVHIAVLEAVFVGLWYLYSLTTGEDDDLGDYDMYGYGASDRAKAMARATAADMTRGGGAGGARMGVQSMSRRRRRSPEGGDLRSDSSSSGSDVPLPRTPDGMSWRGRRDPPYESSRSSSSFSSSRSVAGSSQFCGTAAVEEDSEEVGVLGGGGQVQD